MNALSYHTNRLRHPGQTTAVALLATFAVGFLAIRHIELAAALGVLITLLLSSTSRPHKFALSQLSEQELRDAPYWRVQRSSSCPCCPIIHRYVRCHQAAYHLATHHPNASRKRPRAGLAISGFFRRFCLDHHDDCRDGQTGAQEPRAVKRCRRRRFILLDCHQHRTARDPSYDQHSVAAVLTTRRHWNGIGCCDLRLGLCVVDKDARHDRRTIFRPCLRTQACVPVRRCPSP